MNFPASPRLCFRAWSESDQEAALSLWSDPEVTRYLGGVMSPEEVQARLRLEIERQRKFGFQYWPVYIKEDGHFAGCAGLRPFHEESHVLEVGVHIARRYWSRRLGEEAARAIIQFAFHSLGALALVAGHNPGNSNSKALITLLGFQYTHSEPWGSLGLPHPFYRLARASYNHSL